MNDHHRPDGPTDKIGLRWILLFLAISFGVAWGGWIACGVIAADPPATHAATKTAFNGNKVSCELGQPCA